MKSLALYIFQVLIASGVLYGYYHLFLRNKKFHQYNRCYLLLSFIISIVFPFFKIPVEITETNNPIVYKVLANVTVGTTDSSPFFTISFQTISYILYLLVVAVLFIKFFKTIYRLTVVINQKNAKKFNEVLLIETEDSQAPYSFFKWIFWNNRIPLESEKGRKIFKHEFYHIKHKHSLDIIFSEILTTIFWINPFFHLYKRELKTIHEFLADQFAVKENDEWDYAELLVMEVLQTRHSLVNPFFQNQIKRRIAMITTSNPARFQYLRKLLALPIACFTLALVAVQCRAKDDLSQPLSPVSADKAVAQEEKKEKKETLSLTPVDDKKSTDNVVFTKVEIEAMFPGGPQGWKKYIQTNLNASVPIDNGAPAGSYTVYVKFIVNKDGTMRNLTAETNHGFGMEKEVLRIMNASPKWLPAINNGREVSAYRIQPVTFQITEE